MLLYAKNSVATVRAMKKEKIADWQIQDAKRLLAAYEAYRLEGGLKQEEFAEKFGIRSQGNMGHYLHARQPLNIESAANFARGLGIPVNKFSPTLAEQINAAHKLTAEGIAPGKEKSSEPTLMLVETLEAIEDVAHRRRMASRAMQAALGHSVPEFDASGASSAAQQKPPKSKRAKPGQVEKQPG
jgi:transcriptional regulator with XRE-family HTH domain